LGVSNLNSIVSQSFNSVCTIVCVYVCTVAAESLESFVVQCHA